MNIVQAQANELAAKLSVNQMGVDDLDSQIKDLQAKKKNLIASIDNFKDELRAAMVENEITRIESDDVLFRLDKASEKVDIQDEKLIPDKYFRVKKEVDKLAVKKALQVGDDVNGASLVMGKARLTIRL